MDTTTDLHWIDFTASMPLLPHEHLRVPDGERWRIYERYLELARVPPGAAMRLVSGARTEVAGWAPLCAIAISPGESALQRRVERLEAAVGWDLSVTHGFGMLRQKLVLDPGSELWPEWRGCSLEQGGFAQLAGFLHVAGLKMRL